MVMTGPTDSNNSSCNETWDGFAMARNIKHLLGLAGLLLVSLCYQIFVHSPSNMLTVEEGVSLLVPHQIQRELEETVNLGQRTPVREDEFWLTDNDSAVLPFEVEFLPPDDTYGKLTPLWECDGNAQRRDKKLIFVNIVRTEAMEIQELLSSYADKCHTGFASTVMCSGLSWESMKDIWSNRRTKGSKSGVKCSLQKGSIDRDGLPLERKTKNIQKSLLEEYVDMIAGQVPLGSHEQWKTWIDEQKQVVDVQYVVSLRCPHAWFISNMVDKVKVKKEKEHVETEDIISAIKEKVESDLERNMYHEVYARYLITPSQISWIQKEDAELDIENRVELSLTNLKRTNALILISESKTKSLDMLQFVIDKSGRQRTLFQKVQSKVMEDKEEQSSLETKITNALKEDKVFFQRLQEYLKYESKIYEMAKDMHQRQALWLEENQSTLLA